MGYRHATACSILVLALAALPARAAASEPIELPEGEPWRHEPSGFVFPPDLVTFTRVSAYRYDDEGRNVSVGYGDRALKIVMTAYVYPHAGQSLEAHFDRVMRDVKQVHPKAQVLSEGGWKQQQQGGLALSGRRAAFGFRVAIGGVEQDVVSEAYLLRHGGHFIKFRVTCPKERYEAAADRVARFLQALKAPSPESVPEK